MLANQIDFTEKKLKFKPKYNFKKLINEMIIEDLKLAKSELIIKKSVND